MKTSSHFKIGMLLAGCLVLLVPIAHAESIMLAASGYPPFAEALGRITEDPDRYFFSDGRYSRYLVRGESMEDWSEVLEVNTFRRPRRFRSAEQWFKQFSATAQPCQQWILHDVDSHSVTYEIVKSECQPPDSEHSVARVLFGRTSMYVVMATTNGPMDEEAKAGWLAFLADAKVENGLDSGSEEEADDLGYG